MPPRPARSLTLLALADCWRVEVRRIALVALVVIVTATVTALGFYYYNLTRTPGDIRRACGYVNDAYSSASSRAETVNTNLDQRDLAHPYRVADVWRAEEQAKLERAAREVRDRYERPVPGDDWFAVAASISTAATAMDPTTVVAGETSAVDQENALANASAACVGRNDQPQITIGRR
jgi:hypothetical protein